MSSGAIHVGDGVRFRLGSTVLVGQVREDRGPIGAIVLCIQMPYT